MAKEIWKPIPGYEGLYWASGDGAIRSRNIVISRRVSTRGYLQVHLKKNGQDRVCQVSRLVAAAFHGPPTENALCCHNNGNRLDNRPANLRWDTARNNQLDKLAHGTLRCGEKSHWTKLKVLQVIEIKSLLSDGLTCASIAKKFGVSPGAIDRIKHGFSWSHLNGETNVRNSKQKREVAALKAVK